MYFLSINETHQEGNNTVELEGYKWFPHNRSSKHVRTPKTHGGVSIFVKLYLLDIYNVKIIDKDIDGMIGIIFEDKVSGYTIVIFSCYLPPESSPWGRNAPDFCSHLLSQLYTYSDVDMVFVCGDFNAKIGNKNYIINCMDDIPERCCLDKATNSHGNTFLEFLNDSKLWILNGRLKPANDN